jgi:prevent-host-death family protein
MKSIWQLREAKNKLSEVIDAALEHGPEIITRRGVDTAVVLSYEEYRKMLLNQKKLSDFFRESPLAGIELDLTRSFLANLLCGLIAYRLQHKKPSRGLDTTLWLEAA